MIVSVTGGFHLLYLKIFVVPDLLYCTYYDEYNYRLVSFETGCDGLEVQERLTNDEGDLIYLHYFVGNVEYKRYYEHNQIKKTIEVLENISILLNDDFELWVDRKEIITDYLYQENSFKQERLIEYHIDDQLVLSETGYYEAVRYEGEEVKPAYTHYINIKKELSKPVLVEANTLSLILDDNYFDQIKEEISRDLYLETLQTYVANENNRTFTDVLWVSDSQENYNVGGRQLDYYYQDETIDAWQESDARYNFRLHENNAYYEIDTTYHKQLLNSININHEMWLKISCDESVNYCDGNYEAYGQPVIVRYLITKKNGIRKVEAYDLFEKDYLNFDRKNIDTTKIQINEKLYLDYFPFDDYASKLELFEEPRPYLKIKSVK